MDFKPFRRAIRDTIRSGSEPPQHPAAQVKERWLFARLSH